MPRTLQLDGVEFAELRKVVDQKFADLHDSLEEAYYGQRDSSGRFTPGTGWKDGVSVPWNGFDKGNTPAASKEIFDRLHGQLFHEHHLALIDENTKQGERYSADKIDPVDEQGARRSTGLREALKGKVRLVK